MDPHPAYNTYNEKQDQPIYCAGAQHPEDILCEGSDGEQTAAEIIKKRHGYEETGRRYLSGHRLLIKSATLRGPLSRESGWVNPWRSRRRKEEEWWQPGSEEMLFTRKNVMRRAADHGVGYLNPAEALAWCKDAAETEAMELLHSLDVAQHSGESEIEGIHKETKDFATPLLNEDHQPNADLSARNPPTVNTSANTTKSYESADSTQTGIKRLADTRWLKGSYVSKRARWENPPQPSPTPLPNPPSEKDRRLQRKATKHLGYHTQHLTTTSHATIPLFQDAQQGVQISRGPAQETHSGNNERGIRPQAEDLDELHDDSQETCVSAPNFMASSQVKMKPSKPKSISINDMEPDDLMAISRKCSFFGNPAETSNSSIRTSVLQSNKLPILSRSPDNHGVTNLVEDPSFVTEVAPSSRNLEKFQFHRKKQRKLKQRANESQEGSRNPSVLSQLLPSPAPVGRVDVSDCGIAVQSIPFEQPSRSIIAETVDDEILALSDSLRPLPALVPILVAEKLDDEASSRIELQVGLPEEDLTAKHEQNPHVLQQLQPTSLSEERLLPMQVETASSKSKHLDDSYFKKIASFSANVLPDLNFSSPFGLFGSLDGAVSAATKTPTICSTPKLQLSNKDNYELVFHTSEHTTLEMASDPEALDNTQRAIASGRPGDTATGIGTSLKISEDLDNAMASDEDEFALVDVALPSLNSSNVKRSSADITQSRLSSPTAAKGNESLRTEDLSQTFNASTVLDIGPLNGTLFDHVVESLNNAENPAPAFRQSTLKLQTMPKPKETIAKMTQKEDIDEGSTQSVDTTPPQSTRKSRMSSRFDPISHHRVSLVRQREEIDVVQNALSQHRRGSNSNGSLRCDEDLPSQPLVSAVATEPGVEQATPSILDEEAQVLPVEEQESWQGCGPQSPWGSETIPEHNSNATLNHEFLPIATQDPFVHIGNSSLEFEENLCSDWQLVERPIAQHTGGTMPLKNIGSPTPSTQRLEVSLDHEVISNTQQLIEAATKNPWASNSRKPILIKTKKRVSFGDVVSEENLNSELEISTSAKQWPTSPPPPQPSDGIHFVDLLDSETPVISKFEKHFSAASRYKRTLPKTRDSQLRSPATSAMAERFIAADREASIEQERLPSVLNIPTHHLQPKSDSRTNFSPETTDYNLEVNLDDVLGDAGEFLNDWSVDFEVKKVRDSRGKGDKSYTASKRGEFGFEDSWS